MLICSYMFWKKKNRQLNYRSEVKRRQKKKTNKKKTKNNNNKNKN